MLSANSNFPDKLITFEELLDISERIGNSFPNPKLKLFIFKKKFLYLVLLFKKFIQFFFFKLLSKIIFLILIFLKYLNFLKFK
jgi:hypothetical protein